MKNGIVDDGPWRLRRGQEALQSKSIQKKYAMALAKAGPDEKEAIHRRIVEESAQRERMLNHHPSAKTLW